MAIMQVNVRPAQGLRSSLLSTNNKAKLDEKHADGEVRSQGGEAATASPQQDHLMFDPAMTGMEEQTGSLIDTILRKPLSSTQDNVELPTSTDVATAADVAPDQADGAPLWQRIVWKLTPATTVGGALNSATQRLQSAELDTPRLDAQVILAHVLGKDRSWLFAHHDYKLNKDEADAYTELIVRRMAHEPVAYLTGHREFYGLEFMVDQRVLIPRPETELLVDAVLDQIEMRTEDLPPGRHIRVADVGTGSGAIALAVASNCPEAVVFATDVSDDAINVARENIKRLDNRCQVRLLQGDLLEPLAKKVDMERVDIIAANLPYINSNDYSCLAPGVREYEPQLALEAGPEGLDTIRRLLEQAPNHLNPNGIIFLEIGANQGGAVLGAVNTIVPQARLADLRQDYNGRDRLVTILL